MERRSLPRTGYMTHTVSAPSLHGKTVGPAVHPDVCEQVLTLKNLPDRGDWGVVPHLAHRFRTVPVTFWWTTCSLSPDLDSFLFVAQAVLARWFRF